jgi:putative restriction endonuclease
MRRDVPLIYFHAIAKGKYLAVWPVFIVGDDPAALTFRVAVDDAELALSLARRTGAVDEIAEYDADSRRRYVTGLVRRRLHQRTFRERVLRAYHEQCALCRLRHGELLDAAHIVPDSEELGEPHVPNGISLCKLHHAAFDAFFLAVRPDYRIEIPGWILDEDDGPMLVHGLQKLHRQRIALPRNARLKPDPELLASRYERFLSSGAR